MPIKGAQSRSTWLPRSSEATSISASLPSSTRDTPSQNASQSFFSIARAVMACLAVFRTMPKPSGLGNVPCDPRRRPQLSQTPPPCHGMKDEEHDDGPYDRNKHGVEIESRNSHSADAGED